MRTPQYKSVLSLMLGYQNSFKFIHNSFLKLKYNIIERICAIGPTTDLQQIHD